MPTVVASDHDNDVTAGRDRQFENPARRWCWRERLTTRFRVVQSVRAGRAVGPVLSLGGSIQLGRNGGAGAYKAEGCRTERGHRTETWPIGAMIVKVPGSAAMGTSASAGTVIRSRAETVRSENPFLFHGRQVRGGCREAGANERRKVDGRAMAACASENIRRVRFARAREFLQASPSWTRGPGCEQAFAMGRARLGWAPQGSAGPGRAWQDKDSFMSEPLNIASDSIGRFPHITGIAPQTVKLIEMFKEWTPGQSATDAEMSALIGRDVRSTGAGSGAGNLASALKYVERHHGRVVRRVKGAGLVKCLSANEIVGVVDSRRQHVSRTIRRAGSELTRMEYDKLNDAEKSHALILQSLFAVLSTHASTARQKLIAANQDHERAGKQQQKMLQAM